MIYLDNSATTKVMPEVLDAMLPYLQEEYGNAGTLYKLGIDANKAVEKAREQVAKFIGAKRDQIIFTSSGTEANNMVFYGIKKYLESIDKKHICFSSVEHDSVFRAGMALFGEKTCIKDGFYTHIIKVKSSGEIDLDDLKNVLEKDSNIGLVSIMFVNNETGVINPVKEISNICKEYGVLFHTDCVQAAGCVLINVEEIGCDFATISGHKIGAPKGVGALYIKNKDIMKPMIYGGESQEFGLRGGTQNVPGIVGIGKACEIYGSSINVNIDCTEYNRRFFYEELTDCMTKNGLNDIINVNGDTFENGCKVLNLHIKNVDAETLMILLNAKGMCVSAGSACRSHEQLPSRTLTSMSIDKEEARNSIRLSFSSDIKIEDLKDGARLLADSIKQLSIN